MKNLLINLVEENKEYTNDGQLASYIPALLRADKEHLGVCVVDIKNKSVEEFAREAAVQIIGITDVLIERQKQVEEAQKE